VPSAVGAAFREFLGRIELNPARVELASTRYAHVKRILESALPFASVRQIGSFRRRTKIRPRDLGDGLDVDVLVSLSQASRYAQTPAEEASSDRALTEVYSAVRTSDVFKAMGPQKDAPVVVLEYADAFQIELVPAIEDATGSRTHSDGSVPFWVPKPGGGWMAADYDYDANLISAVNRLPALGGALVPTIKLLKSFSRSRGLPLKSFHLEIIAALALPRRAAKWNANGKTWDFPHALAAVLEDAHLQLNGPIALPESYSPAIDSGLQRELAGIGSYLHEAAADAWRLCMDPSEERALDGWVKFFGEPFPAPSGFV
jgi:hypothetical protein